MKPREYARRKAQELQREGVPYHIARVEAGRLTRRRNPRPQPIKPEAFLWLGIGLTGVLSGSWGFLWL